MKLKNGFTLIELLVVVAIIAVLVAIMLPALNSAREKGKQMTCLSQQKQIGVATMMYINDNNDWMPMSRAEVYSNIAPFNRVCWISQLNPYVSKQAWGLGQEETPSSVFRCPSNLEEVFVYNLPARRNLVSSNYMYSARLGYQLWSDQGYDYGPRRVTKCEDSSEAAILVDGRCMSLQRVMYDFATLVSAVAYVDVRHNSAANTLYADLHAEGVRVFGMTDVQINRMYFWNSLTMWPR